MTKKDIKIGSKTIKDFANFINERHLIWIKRNQGLQKPWTDDPILQQYKFTNIFRQLDTGTIYLHKYILKEYSIVFKYNNFKFLNLTQKDLELIIFNICWYRNFNWYKHAEKLGFIIDFSQLENYINNCWATDEQIFTNAYLRATNGTPCFKHKYYLDICKRIWNDKNKIVEICKTNSLQKTAEFLANTIKNLGIFTAYEIVCDLRFTTLLENAVDKLTWTNLGPGAKRGLKWLNMNEELESIIQLYNIFANYPSPLNDFILSHFINESSINTNTYPPFELREVEHSLCEFDKYCRTESGIGKPKMKYNGL